MPPYFVGPGLPGIDWLGVRRSSATTSVVDTSMIATRTLCATANHGLPVEDRTRMRYTVSRKASTPSAS